MPTIKDVARQAGVSIATVSRAYNGSPLVSTETTRRVMEVATRLDYFPNSAARSLSMSRTHVVGVLLPDLYGEFFSEVIRGIDHAARRAGFQILVSCSHADTRELLTAVRSMRGRIDGLIAMAPNRESASALREIAQYFPLVLLNPAVEIDGCDAISIANYDGAYEMVRHLIGLGHRRIATICGPGGNIDADERLRGYRDAVRKSRLGSTAHLEFSGDFTESAGYDAAARILAIDPRPTAVFAANDYLAIGLISALREAGVRIPEEIAVCGFDDIAIARFVSPPLSTVHVDAYGLGRRAIEQWLASAGGGGSATPCCAVLPTKVVLRGSSGSSTLGRDAEPPAKAAGSARKPAESPAARRAPKSQRARSS